MNCFTKLLSFALTMTMMTGILFAQNGPKTYPYKVGSTISMVADIVAQVAGDKAEVTNIIGEGVDPHLYKPTRNDVLLLMRSDIIFYSGLMLEGKMADALIKVATRGTPVFAVTELLDEKFLLEPEEFAGHFDPHVWMDVKGWMKGVDVVAKSLGEWDSKNAEVYKANAATYNARLKSLDEYVARVIASVPKKSRVLVTAHDAFNYFGRAYDLEVVGIQGISTASQAGLQDINRIVDLLVKKNIRAVFVESSVSSKNIKALVEGAKSKGHDVVIGGELFSDAMGKAGTYEGTYIGMLDHNATTVARALGGKAPLEGLNGKLTHTE
ncbi:MAG: zinc ABC transporter substrate-binding protein [Planctomycetota bacterium]|nr:zinc ABC transporter substrate-binding protein [Planctomycetota bacterium]